MKVFLLWHTHELTDDLGTHDEEKLIGVFSSFEKANETKEKTRSLEGFRDYPEDCFSIDEEEVDRPCWTEGFCTVRWVE